MRRSGLGTTVALAVALAGPVIEIIQRLYGSGNYNEGPYGA